MPLVIAFAALLAALLLLGPAAERSAAAQCKGGDESVSETGTKAAEKITLCLLNKERAASGLRALRKHSDQQQAASAHNRLMVKKDCFSHVCPGERDLVGRISSAGYLPCNCSWGVGENIAWGTGSTSSPKAIVSAWMGSSAHRANILSPRFEEIGVAIDEGSPGGPHHGAATYTTDFGFKS